jgi:hypothetical protein
MSPTRDSQPELIFAPPADGLLAMLALARMTTTTAAPIYTRNYDAIALNVISICRHEQRAPQPQEQNTSSTAPVPHREPCSYTDVGFAAFKPDSSTAIGAAPQSFRARDAIFELRRLSGLTWEELATLLEVTRRSLHLWANGGPINGVNEKHVRDLLIAMRALDRGTARENRGLLLAPLQGGGTLSELLQARRFEDAVDMAGRGPGRPVSTTVREVGAKAGKISVVDMLGTRSDRLHTDEGTALPPRRGRRRGI